MENKLTLQDYQINLEAFITSFDFEDDLRDRKFNEFMDLKSTWELEGYKLYVDIINYHERRINETADEDTETHNKRINKYICQMQEAFKNYHDDLIEAYQQYIS